MLPDRPNLDQLRKQAKDARAAGEHPTLAAAQLAVARAHGFPSWQKLKTHVELVTLRRLITEGEVAPVVALLQSSPSLASATFDEGDTPLTLAAGENRPELVEVLVGRGAPLTSRIRGSGHTALSWAVTCWAFEAAAKLVELGDEPDLFIAAGMGRLDKVQAFWPDGTRRPRPSRTGSSRYGGSGERLPCPPPSDADQVSDALYIACRSGRFDVARWLLDHGADPNWRGYAGATCLAWAEFSGDSALCALLRERGGRDDIIDSLYRSTPAVFALMIYAGWGFAKKLAVRLSADPSIVNTRSGAGTLLHAAAGGGQMKAVEMLLLAGTDATARNGDGQTPAELAAAHGHQAIAAMLQQSGTP